MTTIHFVGGEIGGAGKTMFCMVLLEGFLHYEIPYHFRDADRTTPNVGWAYDPTHYVKNSTLNPSIDARTLKVDAESQKKTSGKSPKQAKQTRSQTPDTADDWLPVIFSEDFDDFSKADRLIDLAGERDVIVNLPAQISNSFDKWIEAGDFLNIQEELGIKFIYWWVAKAEQRSIDLLFANIQRFPNLPHVLVCNQVRGVGEKWSAMLTEELQEALHDLGVRIMDMPELQLAPDERGLLDRENPRFQDLTSDSDKRLSIASKARCKKFVKTSLNNIFATGYLAAGSPEKTTESQPEAKLETANA
jgi:hypothetical protein